MLTVNPLAQGLVASLFAGLATGLGGLPVLLGQRVQHRAFDAVLGFAAGVMFAVSAGALLVEFDPGDPAVISAAALGGAVVLVLRAVGSAGRPAGHGRIGRGARIAIVVTLHNVVEGLAVVAAFGDLGSSVGVGMALAIAIHNIPEGLAIAEPLHRSGVPPGRCALVALISGLGEPAGALLALLAFSLVPPGSAAALAAGAMIVLASTELIPEAFSHSYVTEAAAGLLLGVLVALALLAVPW